MSWGRHTCSLSWSLLIHSYLTLSKATHSSESPQQLRIGEADEGKRHDEAEQEEEPGVVLASILGANRVPVRAAGALQALRDEPEKDQEFTRLSLRTSRAGAAIPGLASPVGRMPKRLQ